MENFIFNQPLLILLILIVLSLIILVVCSRYLIDGSVALARQLRISPLIIGTTIIGMGTSIDELMVNLSSLQLPNASSIVMGNVLGSNMVNLALGLGIPALITTISATAGIIEKEIPIYLGLTALITSFAADGQLTQKEGFFLVSIFFGIVLLIYQSSLQKKHEAQFLSMHPKTKRHATLNSVIKVFGGLSLMLIGSRILVLAASGVATKLNVNSYIISLFIVGIGTSLPEIFASIQAAISKKSDIVLGNVLGSNIFNLCFGLGIPMLYNKFSINSEVMKDLYFINLLGVVTVFLILLDTRWLGHKKKINVMGGLVLIAGFFLFIFQKF